MNYGTPSDMVFSRHIVSSNARGMICPCQGELEGGRKHFWHWKDMELLHFHWTSFLLPANIGKYGYDMVTWLSLSDVAYWTMHAQYFALINLHQKLELYAEASFSLLLIVLCPPRLGQLRGQVINGECRDIKQLWSMITWRACAAELREHVAN